MSETILVTGACGFTGSNMLEYLAEQRPEATIVATDLPGSQRDEYYVAGPDSDDPQPVYYDDVIAALPVEFIPADLTEPDDVARLTAAHEYDTVFHIASLFDYFAQREALYAVNVGGTRNLLSELAAQSNRPRVVHWSTLGVLGNAGFDEPKTEAAGYHPHNRYCESKVAQEQVVNGFATQLDVTIIRPAPIYGPRHQYGVYHVVTLVDRLPLVPIARLYPRSRQLQFPTVHVLDVVRAAVYLADHPDAVDETYNVLSDCIGQDELLGCVAADLGVRHVPIPLPYQLYALFAKVAYPLAVKVEEIARLRGTRPFVDAPMLRYLTANMWFSNEKLKETGFVFVYEDPRDGLGAYLEWCRDVGWIDRTAWASRARAMRESMPDVSPPSVRSVGQTVRGALSRG